MKNALLFCAICLSLFSLVGCSGNSSKDDSDNLFPAEVVSESGKIVCGYINKSGEFVIPPQFQDARDFAEGLACVRINDWRYGFIDRTGRVVIDYLDEECVFSEGLAAVRKDDLLGFLTRRVSS